MSSQTDRAAKDLVKKALSLLICMAAMFSAMHWSRMLRIELAVTPEAAGDASDIPLTAKHRQSDLCCGGASGDFPRIVIEKTTELGPAPSDVSSVGSLATFGRFQPVASLSEYLPSTLPQDNLESHPSPSVQQISLGTVSSSLWTHEDVEGDSDTHATATTNM